MDYGVKRVRSIYEKEYLPLALELYTHHVQSSDLVLLNSLLSFNNVGPSTDCLGATNPSIVNRDNTNHNGNDIDESIF